MYLNICINPPKCTFPGFSEHFSNLGTADINYAPVDDLLIKSSIKTENNLMDFYDYSWKYCPDTGRSTVAYIILYQGGHIDHGTHVPGPVAQ